LGRGFIGDGGDHGVTVFDLKTLAVITKIKTVQNPSSHRWTARVIFSLPIGQLDRKNIF
jgi:hypothetical protein